MTSSKPQDKFQTRPRASGVHDVRLVLSASSGLMIFIALSHGLAIILIALSALPFAWVTGLAFVVIYAGVRAAYLHRAQQGLLLVWGREPHLLLPSHSLMSVRGVRLRFQGFGLIVFSAPVPRKFLLQAWARSESHPSLALSRFLLIPKVLNYSLFLTPGNCDPDRLRQLRVQLKYYGSDDSAA